MSLVYFNGSPAYFAYSPTRHALRLANRFLIRLLQSPLMPLKHAAPPPRRAARQDPPSQGIPMVADYYERAFKAALSIFVGSIVFSVAGMLLLRLVPAAAAFFAPIYQQLVQAPTWTYMTLLPVLPVLMYARSLGWKRIAGFAAWGCLVGGASELIGTTGFATVQGLALPFGAYEYTNWLGPRLAGHVPYFIPLSWFAMSVISLDLASRLVRSAGARVVLGAVFMVLWDVALDPAMNRAFPFWTYAESGFFFGMPLSNWIGWFVVSLVILAGYELAGGLRRANPWAPTVYALNGLFPLAISMLSGLYLAAFVGAAAVACPLLLVWWKQRARAGAPSLASP